MITNRSSFSPSLRRAISLAIAMSAGCWVSQGVLAADAEKETKEEENVATLSDVNVSEDPLRALSNEPSAASFGFAKPLLETPRTVTFVSEEQLRLYGVSTVEDLSRLVPGTYTTTRYGLQGGISVRGVSADFYYRGMRRLQMQGHVRTVLSAYDNIEVIKGPPSPLYGMGQIGGYANLDPKSNRAKTGKYMTESTGYFQATHDYYGKNETQFGLGVPFSIATKPSGVYFVGLLEDSKTYVKTVPAKQKFLQATLSVDNAVGPFRLEMGGQIQNSITAGAYFTRVTQELIDDGVYITGRPLAELDLNRDGRVGYVESYLASPVTGAISGNNQALDQRFVLKADANGNPLPIASFANSIVGIPQSMKTYLTTGPGSTLDCPMANYMRTTAPVMTLGTATTGPLVTRNLPVGFVMNPCTTGKVKLTDSLYRANGAYEREQNADQSMAYLDLIYDTNPNFTIKNQLFYDSIGSFKDSFLPYGENQAIHTYEDKVTATVRVPAEWLPTWLSINSLGSINYRETSGYIRSSGGDWDYRQDITYTTGADGSGTGGFYSNTMFWTQLSNSNYQTGAVDTANRYSTYSEKGAGLMFDITFGQKTNLVLGARSDEVKATVNESPAFNPNTGNIGVPTQALLDAYAAGLACTAPGGPCPGAYLAPTADVSDSDRGQSYSASLSHELPWGRIRPYVTAARSTITLDGSNNLYARGTVLGGKIIGEAELKEVGIKGELFKGRAQWTLSGFRQDRTDVSNPSDPSLSAFATSTTTEGVEGSLNIQATRKLFVGASLTLLKPRYTTGLTPGQTIDVNARDLGFQDITLPTGEIYPAEAFGYGGRLRVLVNDPNNIYDEVPGSPEKQATLNLTYTLPKGFGLLANAQYFSESWANRLQTESLPSTTLLNVGATWDYKRVHLKGNLYNVTDELQFRATSGGNPNMLSVLPDRRYELSMKIDF
jgi:iron complex outermembrane recepter protein